MTPVRSTAERAEVAADRERDRVAWNLSRTPARVREAPVGLVSAERNVHGTRPFGDVPPSQELDWDGFVAAFFPGSRRHDLKALAAYGAYKRSQGVADNSRISTPAGSIERWEDEGGAAHELTAP
jgi:hypothetical protein